MRSAGIDFIVEECGDLRIPKRSEAVGDLVIGFDGGEITVFIGCFMHRHFTPGACGDPSADDEQAECVRVAAQFVTEVLSDLWVLWTYPNGAGGCYRIDGDTESTADTPIEDDGEHVPRFVWSGPWTP